MNRMNVLMLIPFFRLRFLYEQSKKWLSNGLVRLGSISFTDEILSITSAGKIPDWIASRWN